MKSTKLNIESLETRNVLSTVSPLSILGNVDATADPQGITPQQMRKAYGFDKTFINYDATAGLGQTIAIIDAFNPESVVKDLAYFCKQFGLPAADLTVLNQRGGTEMPTTSEFGWGLETALNVQWAHVIAPMAKIILISTDSNETDDMIAGVEYAKSIADVSVISMSWGAGELDENWHETDDAFYVIPPGHKPIAFVAASGNDGRVLWPSSHPNVVAVGGTSLFVDDSGARIDEVTWEGSGGGDSAIYPNERTPDVAYNANPYTGVPVRFFGIWWQVGGTSSGTPQVAAMYTLMEQLAKTPITDAFAALANQPQSFYNDIVEGGSLSGYEAAPGRDYTSGWGSPRAQMFLNASPKEDRYVANLYNDVLNRNGDVEGITYFAGLLKGGMDAGTVAYLFHNSAEAHKNSVNQTFEHYLGREADDGALNYFVPLMLKGYSLESVVTIVSSSTEATLGNQRDVQVYLSNLYINEMGTPIDTAAMAYFESLLKQGYTRYQLSNLIMTSTQHKVNRINQYYVSYLFRGSELPTTLFWLDQLRLGANMNQIGATVISSAEYIDKV